MARTPYRNLGGEAPESAVREQLRRLLDSPHFRSSRKCSRFLRYVVERLGENSSEPLKERTIGVEVFGREPDYDTNHDPVVRSAAGETRKRLAQYYLEREHENEIRIGLPVGHYAPEIAPPQNGGGPVEPAGRHHRFRLIGIVTAVAALAGAALWLYLPRTYSGQSDLDRFWEPLVRQKVPVVVCLGQGRPFYFAPRVQTGLEEWFEGQGQTGDPPPMLGSISLGDVIPAWDTFVALPDAQALVGIADLLVRRGSSIELLGARASSLKDLRGRPSVLVGAFNNQWTLNLTGELRYWLDIDEKRGGFVVRDQKKTGMAEWEVSTEHPGWANTVDYAIVSRFRVPLTEQIIVAIAGTTWSGTLAGGEFVTDESYFAKSLSDAPPDWYQKNIQVVLSTEVIEGVPGPPEVAATHFW